MNDILLPNEISVRHDVCSDINREFITFSVPNGWDDVKKVCHKVMLFDGRRFIFSGWNSDRNECFFFRFINGKTPIATWD